MKTQWVTSVDEFVDDAGGEMSPGAVLGVRVVLADGREVQVTEHGRELVEFMLVSLCAGQRVHVDAEDELLSPDRAAELLDVTRPTVYRWQDAQLLPTVKQGRMRAVPADAVMELKAARDSRAAADALAQQAREQSPAEAVTSADLLASVQHAVRGGRPGDAAGTWRNRRVTAVADAARAAREALAGAAEE